MMSAKIQIFFELFVKMRKKVTLLDYFNIISVFEKRDY